MTDLTPITATGAGAPLTERFGSLTLTENPGLGLCSLALRKGQDTLPGPFGLILPDVGQVTTAGAFGAFWTGPGQWMIEGQGLAETDFAAQLKAQTPGASITEQTDGFVAFDIHSDSGGDAIEALMTKLVNIDPATLGPGRVTRTGMEHMTVFLIRRERDRLSVLGMRSLAGSVWHALTVAARRLEG